MSKMSFVICHVLEVVCRVREKRQAALLKGKQVGRLRAYPPLYSPSSSSWSSAMVVDGATVSVHKGELSVSKSRLMDDSDS